ncbi:hypothetical protein ACFO4O_14425 [Glaciecola siphonariae]|uniref:Uncharacterized protein n=1 Tax=Glaciecola siphonariae TaxID=521012 RepID=A0ABV9LXZ1_9ALTE
MFFNRIIFLSALLFTINTHASVVNLEVNVTGKNTYYSEDGLNGEILNEQSTYTPLNEPGFGLNFFIDLFSEDNFSRQPFEGSFEDLDGNENLYWANNFSMSNAPGFTPYSQELQRQRLLDDPSSETYDSSLYLYGGTRFVNGEEVINESLQFSYQHVIQQNTIVGDIETVNFQSYFLTFAFQLPTPMSIGDASYFDASKTHELLFDSLGITTSFLEQYSESIYSYNINTNEYLGGTVDQINYAGSAIFNITEVSGPSQGVMFVIIGLFLLITLRLKVAN